MMKSPNRIVRFSYLMHATGLSRGACYREMKNNPEFPKKISLGGRAIGFNVDEVDALMEMKSIFEERGNTKEIYRIQERIDYLNKFISDRKTMDDEILEYATQLMNEFPEEKKQVNQKSYGFIWLLLGGIVVLLIFGILRRP